jgi:hypothetical protein
VTGEEGKMTDSIPVWRDERWVSQITGICLPTLRNARSVGKGIPFYRFGRTIKYREADVIEWAEARRVETTR